MRRLLPDPRAHVDIEAEYAVAADLRWHLRASFVSSADGAVTVDGRSGGLGGPADTRVFGLLRDLSDVIIVGAGTARAEGYGVPVVGGDRLERRRRHGLPDVPVLVLVSHSLDLDPAADFFADPRHRTVVLTRSAAPGERRSALERVADVMVCGAEEVDLAQALLRLREQSLRRAHFEGGPRLLGSALAAGVVDELCLTIAPVLAGAGAGRIVGGPPLPAPVDARLAHVLEEDGSLFLRYDLGPAD